MPKPMVTSLRGRGHLAGAGDRTAGEMGVAGVFEFSAFMLMCQRWRARRDFRAPAGDFDARAAHIPEASSAGFQSPFAPGAMTCQFWSEIL